MKYINVYHFFLLPLLLAVWFSLYKTYIYLFIIFFCLARSFATSIVAVFFLYVDICEPRFVFYYYFILVFVIFTRTQSNNEEDDDNSNSNSSGSNEGIDNDESNKRKRRRSRRKEEAMKEEKEI